MARELKIIVSADESGAIRSLKALQGEADKFGSKFKDVGTRVSDVGKRMTAFVSLPIAAGLGYATKAASDLSEAVNVTGLTFKDSRGEIDAFVKTTAKGLGQSERAAREATATFGGLLQNLGVARQESVKWSMDLTRLASDLGSAFNKDPAEAVQALGSALRGETEPIRAFNVMLDDATVRAKAVEMGLAKTTAEVDKHGKTQATLALIMEQTKAVQGDFANTSEGLANKSRILRAQLEDVAAKLGTQLIPFALKAASAVQRLVEGFANLDPIIQSLALGAAAFLAALGPLVTVAGSAMRAISGLATATVFLATSSSAAAVSMTTLGLSVGGLLVGYAALRASLAAVKRAEDDLVSSQATAINTAALGAEATKEQAVEAYMNAAALNTQTDALKGATFYGEQFAEVQKLARENLERLSDATGVSKERIVELANEMGINLGAMSDTAREKLSAAVTAIARGITPTERLAEVQDTLASKTATAAEEFDAFKEALDAALGVVLDADEASLKWQESIAALTETVEENGKQFGFNTAKQREVTSATIDAVQAARDEVEAFALSGRVAADAATQQQELANRLNLLKQRFPELGPLIDGYISKLNTIPTTKTTTIDVELDPSRAVSQFRQMERDFANRTVTVPTTTQPSGRRGGGSGAGKRSEEGRRGAPRAHGGPVFAGHVHTVGERGREDVLFARDGYVIPHDLTMRLRRMTEGRRSFGAMPSHVLGRTVAEGPTFKTDVRVTVSGGSQEVVALVRQGVKQGLDEFKRDLTVELRAGVGRLRR